MSQLEIHGISLIFTTIKTFPLFRSHLFSLTRRRWRKILFHVFKQANLHNFFSSSHETGETFFYSHEEIHNSLTSDDSQTLSLSFIFKKLKFLQHQHRQTILLAKIYCNLAAVKWSFFTLNVKCVFQSWLCLSHTGVQWLTFLSCFFNGLIYLLLVNDW